MRKLRIVGSALLAVFAFSAIAAGAAHAENPFWDKCSKFEKGVCTGVYERLKKGEKLAFTSNGGEFSLANGTQTITCKKYKTKAGSNLLGSEAGEVATSEQTVEFEECSVTGNGEKCAVEGGKIKTEPLIATVDKQNEKAKEGELLLVSFRPAATSVFVKIKFEAEPGGKCTFTETAVELNGGVKAKLGVAGIADLERACTAKEKEELIAEFGEELGKELCQEGHAPIRLNKNEELGEKGLIFFPKKLLKVEWIEEGGKPVEIKEGLSVFGKAATKFTGHANVLVAGVDWGIFNK